jgi:hypothetical protein
MFGRIALLKNNLIVNQVNKQKREKSQGREREEDVQVPFSIAVLKARATSRTSTKLTPPEGVNGIFRFKNK